MRDEAFPAFIQWVFFNVRREVFILVVKEMASARSDSDFEGFTINDIENINENKSILSSDKSDIDISDFSSDEEEFNNESEENDSLPRLWNYWSPDVRYGDPYISSIMSKTRYSKISQYLHLTDSANAPSKNDPNYDPLYKVRPIIDLLVNNYRTVYLPGKNLSVDEAMIGYKGRVHFRQYMPAKPTKWGIKVWEVGESETEYCVNFDVYTGKKYNGNRPHGLGHDVVWSLTEPFHHQHRHIYFDLLFSSVTLAENLARIYFAARPSIM
eukprot:XP_014784407.1 PREDICTED: uncharacterized protein LOC106879391 [Octopus bimaculoides]